jgi:uncharacterized protein YjbI with pentapeptide repeats
MQGRLRRAYRGPGGEGGSVAEGFTCDVDPYLSRDACQGLDFYGEHEGKRYCMLHYPGEEKNKEDFLKVKKSKLDRQDYLFRGAVFPEGTSDFEGFEFDAVDADANFVGAIFLGQARFTEAKFSGEWTDFSDAQFSGEWTKFSDAQFSGAETYFQEATFMKEVDFTGATFKERASFWGSKANRVFGCGAWAWFNGSRIEKPEQFTFNSVLLHPGWFINNADVRKVDFTDVEWYGMPGGLEGTLAEEIDKLKELRVESPHTLLAQACRRLSANAEENREYPLANEFHYWSMDALRKESWSHFKSLTLRGLKKKETWRDIGEHFGLITTLYWALSGYGVRAARAFWVLMGMWAAFTTLYVLVDPSEFKSFGQGIGYLWQAAVYSLLAMARLNPEPGPDEPGLFQFLVGLEGILGPLQIALLALAVRRKVMR